MIDCFITRAEINPSEDTKGLRAQFKKWKRKKFVPPDVCIICNTKGCHSSKHLNQSKAVFSHLATVLLAENSNDDLCDYSTDESEEENNSSWNLATAFHINEARTKAYMGILESKGLEGAVIDTGSSTLSTIREELVKGAISASCRKTSPMFWK